MLLSISAGALQVTIYDNDSNQLISNSLDLGFGDYYTSTQIFIKR